METEQSYDRTRFRQWLRGEAAGFSRRDLLRLTAAVGVLGGTTAAGTAEAAGPIRKPLPPEKFTMLGTNAEMRWAAMRDQGRLVPVDRFFVRNHTSTPIIDPLTWRLEVTGAGLSGGPAAFTLADRPGPVRDPGVP